MPPRSGHDAADEGGGAAVQRRGGGGDGDRTVRFATAGEEDAGVAESTREEAALMDRSGGQHAEEPDAWAACRTVSHRSRGPVGRRLRRRRREHRLLWAGVCCAVVLPGCVVTYGSTDGWWARSAAIERYDRLNPDHRLHPGLGAAPRGEVAAAAGPPPLRRPARRQLLQTGAPIIDTAASSPPSQAPSCSPTEPGQLYPPDIFTKKQRKDGAIILYVFGIFYMFAGLAIVCDDYFVAALEVITDRLDLSEDVAGATFMAAGGSAPELFTSLAGRFIANNNSIGFGTIVGSAVFNVLFVIGCCAVATRGLAKKLADEHHKNGGEVIVWYHQGLPLTAWPLGRDSFFYGIDLAVLIYFFETGPNTIEWWEAFVLLLLYGCYVLFMKYNEQIHTAFRKKFSNKITPEEQSEKVQVVGADGKAETRGATAKDAGGEGSEAPQERRASGHHHNTEAAPGRRASIKSVERECRRSSRKSEKRKSASLVKDGAGDGKNATSPTSQEGGDDDDDDDDDGPWHPVDSWKACESATDRLKFLFFFPLNVTLWRTVPNCQDEKQQKWYVWAFLASILWIGTYSVMMVWWADRAGEAADIPPTIMGLTLLAAGTSVPDLISSIVVARAGHGDMAVSSSIGSNIFDICFGLPLPWFLWGVANQKANDVHSQSSFYPVVMLVLMLICTVGTIAMFGWKLNALLGATSVVLYAVFITITLLLEAGVNLGFGTGSGGDSSGC